MNTLDKIKYLRNRVYNSNGLATVVAEDLKELDHYIHLFETGKGGLTDDEITHFNTLNRRYRDSSGMSSQYDFKNKHFAFTGFRDEKLVQILNEKHGSIVHNTVTGITKLDYLICADTSRKTIKMKRAKDKGAVVMTKEELYKHL